MIKLTAGQLKWLASSIILVVATLIVGGCTNNHPPTIENLAVTAEHSYLEETTEGYKVLQGKAYEIECIASDQDSDELFFEWSADGGDISGEGTVVTWTAPHSASEVIVAVTVSDGRGSLVTESVVFAVVTCPCSFN